MPTVTFGENTGDDFGGNSMDNYIREPYPTSNNGSLSTVRVRGLTGDIQHTLLSFPDISSISGPVTVSASSINLYQTANSGFTITGSSHKLLRNWVETESTWNIYSTGNNWTTTGGLGAGTDINGAESGSATITNTIDEYKTITGAQLDTDCENDINGSTTHYGWLTRRSDSTTATLCTFASQSGIDGQRPYLSVTYASAGNTMTMSDTYEFSDTLSMSASVDMSMSDSYVISDTLQQSASILMSLSDSGVFSDTLSVQAGNFMNLADSCVFADTLSSTTGVLTLTLNDGYTFSDALSQVTSATMGMSDTYVISDVVSFGAGDLIEGVLRISVQTKQGEISFIVKKPIIATEISND